MTLQRLAYTVEGEDHDDTIVFIHGWPDDGQLWSRQVDALKAHFRCVSVTLPNFGAKPDRRGAYSFAEQVERLRATIESIQPSGHPVYLVTHDWGAYIGYLFAQSHPEYVRRMVAMDVGANTQPSSLKDIVLVIAYQWHLIGSWFLGGVLPGLGRLHAQFMAWLMKVAPERRARIQSRFGYPYWVLWMDILLPWRRKNLQRSFVPTFPLLFLYGGRKPIMFHTQKWLDLLETTGGASACIEDGDHWFMESHATEVNDMIHTWCAAEKNGALSNA